MSLLKKLQYRQGPVVVLAAPAELDEVVATWIESGVPIVTEQLPGSGFVLVFVRTCAEIEQVAPQVVARLADSDPVLWMAYPKKSSRRYRSDIGRDDSWSTLGGAGFEPVRQVAVDADWSALRFRRTERIGTLTRDPSRALSEQGRRRARG